VENIKSFCSFFKNQNHYLY